MTIQNSINANSVTPLQTYAGGTAISSYTQGDILYASASLILSTLPKNTTATRYLSNTGTSNNPAWAQIALSTGVTGTLPVANGGTGAGTHTAYTVICGGTTTTGALQSVASVGTSGQVLTSNGAAALPTFQTIPFGSRPFTVVTGATPIVVAHGYFDNSAGGVTFTLPATAVVGDSFEIYAMNTGLFTIAQNAGQSIRLLDNLSTVGVTGSLTLTDVGGGLTIVCNVANTGWQVTDALGDFTVA